MQQGSPLSSWHAPAPTDDLVLEGRESKGSECARPLTHPGVFVSMCVSVVRISSLGLTGGRRCTSRAAIGTWPMTSWTSLRRTIACRRAARPAQPLPRPARSRRASHACVRAGWKPRLVESESGDCYLVTGLRAQCPDAVAGAPVCGCRVRVSPAGPVGVARDLGLPGAPQSISFRDAVFHRIMVDEPGFRQEEVMCDVVHPNKLGHRRAPPGPGSAGPPDSHAATC